MKMASSSALGAIAVVAVILTAFGSYYYTATPLNAQVSSYQTSISTYEDNISSYQSVISSMSAHPPTTTIYSTTTQTTTSVITTTLTEVVYPIPNNVTVYLIDGGGGITNYAINAGSISISGSTSTQKTFLIAPAYQNETITISISLTSGYGSCLGGQTGDLYLYIDGNIASQTGAICGSNTNAQISYVL